VVVDDLDRVGMSVSPNEANPPLVVDADRMLSCALLLQRFEAIARRNAQVIEPAGIVQETELPQSHVLNLQREPAAPPAGPDQFGFPIPGNRGSSNAL
jgi:hypothetical protein